MFRIYVYSDEHDNHLPSLENKYRQIVTSLTTSGRGPFGNIVEGLHLIHVESPQLFRRFKGILKNQIWVFENRSAMACV